MITLDADHPKVVEFIRIKKDADFNLWRANLSVVFNGTANHADKRFDQLIDELADAAHYCGEPGVLFFDRFEMDNPTPKLPYLSTAPCAEVGLASGELCHFMYVNLDEISGNGNVDWNKLASAVRLAVRSLDAAVELSIDTGAYPQVQLKRRIGVGVMGFHSLLIRLGIPYASEHAVEIAKQLSEFVTYQAHTMSVELAAERGSFPIFEDSRWTDPVWINRKSSKRTGIISGTEWSHLTDNIRRYGIRNSSVVSYPPTGNASEIVEVSKAYEPFFVPKQASSSTEHKRQNTSSAIKRFLDAGGDPGSPIIATAYEIPARWHLAIHAAFQSFSDESGSKTINLDNKITVNGVRELLRSSREMGLKGLTVFRDRCLLERRN
jgi:ribonucleoside-diphosphate reductase alpha chain